MIRRKSRGRNTVISGSRNSTAGLPTRLTACLYVSRIMLCLFLLLSPVNGDGGRKHTRNRYVISRLIDPALMPRGVFGVPGG